jgi:hypothetical protein
VHLEDDGSSTRITSPFSEFESNRLYRNDNNKFIDITASAGMESSAFGLSVTPADLNRDGWMDLYVANDYIEPDRIFINNKNGTFTDRYEEYLKHSSLNSMGSDVADINNDGLDDIMVLDMKSEDPARYKTLINGMHYDRYNFYSNTDMDARWEGMFCSSITAIIHLVILHNLPAVAANRLELGIPYS